MDFSRLPRAVLFDWDNTLVDAWPVMHDCMNTTLAAMGQAPWNLEEAQRRMARSLREYFPELFGDRWQEARKIYYSRFGEIHRDLTTAFAASEPLLTHLHRAGCHLAVVSNKTGSYLRAEVQGFGWDRYFTQIVGAGDAPRDKPAPDPALKALEKAAIGDGEAVWFIGDTDVDMCCARAIGAVPILVRETPPADHETQRWGDVIHVDDLQTLFDTLSGYVTARG